MPLFITYASYSNTGIKGIIDKPIDRTEPIRTLVEKAGLGVSPSTVHSRGEN